MEISRHLKPSLNLPADTAPVSPVRPLQAAGNASDASGNQALHLDKLQTALSQLPEVDEDKVAMLKLALARGELSLDMATLATSIYTYHRSTDV